MLQIINLTLRIDQRTLVRDLNWTVLPSECWCVIGPNGAGKTTLLRSLAGLRSPDAGRIELGQRVIDAWSVEALAKERSFLPQGRSDAFGYSVLETVLASRHPYNDAHYWESESDRQVVYDALGRLDVQHLADRDIRTLSGGERQRVAIAAVLAQDTPLIVLDEPANALDLAHQVQVMQLLARLCRESGKAVILVSHDLNLAQVVASHALLLMGDGGWHAGPAHDIMKPDLLGRCLGHPITAIRHGKRTIFIPTEGEEHE